MRIISTFPVKRFSQVKVSSEQVLRLKGGDSHRGLMEGMKASRRAAPANIRMELDRLTALSPKHDRLRAYLRIRSRISHAAATFTPPGRMDDGAAPGHQASASQHGLSCDSCPRKVDLVVDTETRTTFSHHQGREGLQLLPRFEHPGKRSR